MEYSLYQFQICIQLASEQTEQDSLLIKMEHHRMYKYTYICSDGNTLTELTPMPRITYFNTHNVRELP